MVLHEITPEAGRHASRIVIFHARGLAQRVHNGALIRVEETRVIVRHIASGHSVIALPHKGVVQAWPDIGQANGASFIEGF
jgi:hypothetical protein